MKDTSKPVDLTNGNPRFSNNQAAEYIGVTHGTLNVGRSRGTFLIPYFKLGKKVVYLKSDLDEYLASRRIDPREMVA